MASAITVFGAHCGDVSGTVTWTNAVPLASVNGDATCAAAIGGTVATL